MNENFIAGNRSRGVPENAGNLWVKYDALGDFKGPSVAGVGLTGSLLAFNTELERVFAPQCKAPPRRGKA